MSSPILLASNNAHKLRELQDILRPHGFQVIRPAEIDLTLEVPETGDSFEANARLKAEAFAAASGLLSLADDSGLVVDALGGEPGIYSARLGGPEASDADRIDIVLDRMRDVPDPGRTARFVAAIALSAPGQEVVTFRGEAEGFITHRPRGTHGFGYDPIFFYPPLGRTFAELDAETKASVSHRGRALRAVVAYLASTSLCILGQVMRKEFDEASD